MSITISKQTVGNKLNETSDLIKTDNYIITPMYGKINVVSGINHNKYSYFDTIEDYDLFISNTANDTVAVKIESILENSSEDNIDNIINEIKTQYKTDKIEWDSTENSIIIKADKNSLLEISKKYNDEFEPNLITDNVLFLEYKNTNIKLEDNTDNILDKLDDSSMKEILNKSGVKTNGSESRDELKGIIKGTMNSNK